MTADSAPRARLCRPFPFDSRVPYLYPTHMAARGGLAGAKARGDAANTLGVNAAQPNRQVRSRALAVEDDVKVEYGRMYGGRVASVAQDQLALSTTIRYRRHS